MVKYYVIYDKLSDSYSNLIAAPSDKALYRSLHDNTPHEFSWRKHPEDFSLHHVLDLSDSAELLPSSPSKPVTILNSLTMVFEKGYN